MRVKKSPLVSWWPMVQFCLVLPVTLLLIMGLSGKGAWAETKKIASYMEKAEVLTSDVGSDHELQRIPMNYAGLEYGTEYFDIGAFTNKYGNWTFWMGWNASFSETYEPTKETYNWVVYFSPEAIYVALQSGKSTYSGVDVNAGFSYFVGTMHLGSETRLRRALLTDELYSVSFSYSPISTSTLGIGIGALGMTNLSFGFSTSMTAMFEKNADKVVRAAEFGAGLSTSVSLIPISIPFVVSIGTDTEPDDHPELGRFVGFYPILIWNLDSDPDLDHDLNPVDLMISRLESENLPAYNLEPTVEESLKKKILETLKIVQRDNRLREFMESTHHNSTIDDLLQGAEQWKATGDTENLTDLPENLVSDDPEGDFLRYRAIGTTANLALDLGYRRGRQSNPDSNYHYRDCVKRVHCTVGEECEVVVSAEELTPWFPSLEPSAFEGLEVHFDRPVEYYMMQAGTEEIVEIVDGEAVFQLLQNTSAPLTIGATVPVWLTNEERWVYLELCRRSIVFYDEFEPGLKRALDGKGGELDVIVDKRIVGTGARETINIWPGLNVDFTAGEGDRVNLPYPLEKYQVTSMGNQLRFFDTEANATVRLIVTGTSIVSFGDGSMAVLEMVFQHGSPPRVRLGGAVVDSTPLDQGLVELD